MQHLAKMDSKANVKLPLSLVFVEYTEKCLRLVNKAISVGIVPLVCCWRSCRKVNCVMYPISVGIVPKIALGPLASTSCPFVKAASRLAFKSRKFVNSPISVGIGPCLKELYEREPKKSPSKFEISNGIEPEKLLLDR